MLPPIIIEHIKKREEEERRRRDQRPFVQLPLPQPAGPRPSRKEDEPERGVVIIDLG